MATCIYFIFGLLFNNTFINVSWSAWSCCKLILIACFLTLTRLQTLNEAMAADEGSRAKEAFSEAVGIITIYKQNSFLQDLSCCVLLWKFLPIWCKLTRDGTGHILFNCTSAHKVLSGAYYICSLCWLPLIWTSSSTWIFLL